MTGNVWKSVKFFEAGNQSFRARQDFPFMREFNASWLNKVTWRLDWQIAWRAYGGKEECLVLLRKAASYKRWWLNIDSWKTCQRDR